MAVIDRDVVVRFDIDIDLLEDGGVELLPGFFASEGWLYHLAGSLKKLSMKRIIMAASIAIYRKLCDMASADSAALERLSRSKTSQLKASDVVATEDFNEDNPLFGFTFCFTGTLEKMGRKEAWQLVVNCGGILGQGVTQETNYLVMGETDYSRTVGGQESSKTQKARHLQ